MDEIKKEINIIKQIDHYNIVKYFDTFVEYEDSRNLYLVMEYVEGGEILDEIDKRTNNELTEELAR